MHARGPGDGRPVKLVAIGIGSVIFGVELLRDVFRVPEFRGAELWLVDLDPGALGRMARLAERLNEAAGWDVSSPKRCAGRHRWTSTSGSARPSSSASPTWLRHLGSGAVLAAGRCGTRQ